RGLARSAGPRLSLVVACCRPASAREVSNEPGADYDALVRALLAGIVVLALAAASMSASAEARSSATTPRKVPGYGVTVSLPPDWIGTAAPAEAASFGVKYLYRAPEEIAGFHANLNLIVSPIPAGMTLRQWLFSGASAAFQ